MHISVVDRMNKKFELCAIATCFGQVYVYVYVCMGVMMGSTKYSNSSGVWHTCLLCIPYLEYVFFVYPVCGMRVCCVSHIWNTCLFLSHIWDTCFFVFPILECVCVVLWRKWNRKYCVCCTESDLTCACIPCTCP